MITFDTETCGLHGMPVLIQYAQDDDEPQLHEIWTRPIRDTLRLVEWMCDHDICAFNNVFDWFHLCKIYTTLRLYPDDYAYPANHIEEIAILEERARFSDVCLKPRRVCDIMLHARKGPYQSLMERDDIRIRRVPTPIAWNLAAELEKRIQFDEIYFARAKDKYAPRWKVYDIKLSNGNINPDFKDIKLRFRASSGLKNLYRHAFGQKEIIEFRDIEVDKKFRPVELGYAPFALAVGTPGNWKGAWPDVIEHHINHWGYNGPARQYAADDVRYTRRLRKEHFGCPEPGDTDSELTVTVANCRWRGYAVDSQRLLQLKEEASERVSRISRFLGVKPKAAGKRHSAVPPKVARKYLEAVMDETERVALHGSTKRVILEEIANWRDDCCEDPNCPKCQGSSDVKHPAAVRAQEILDARRGEKEIEIYDKLLTAGRFHASFKVIGALSSRMAGADGLNPQGIKHDKYVREAFGLADHTRQIIELAIDGTDVRFETKPMILCGGDFKSFEVSLAAKVFDDPELNKAILSGKKIHALLGVELFPGFSYEEILASEGKDPDMYDKGKKGVFLMFYGGDENTFKNKLGISIEIGKPAFDRFINKYKGIKRFGEKVQAGFGALRQVGGIGSRIEYHEPREYAESFLGFKRYFSLENRIVKTLFEIAQNPPKILKEAKIKVMRRDRIQTAGGAAQSALFGAAFGIVSGIVRAVKNHEIQSPGAEITKAVQRAIWNLQPIGVHEWRVQPMNIHDEIMCPMREDMEQSVETVVKETVGKYKELVPLLAIDWFKRIPNWASKKG